MISHGLRYWYRSLFLAFVLALLSSPSFAQSIQKIGAAKSIENEVEGRLGTTVEKLAVGSDVFRDQLVRTGKASTAALQFLDETNLNLSPSTEIKLDRFVYDSAQKKGVVVLQVPRGVVRFVTGTLESRSYSIRTPLVTVGVRGTTFDVLVWPDRVTVLLVAGAVDLTPRARRVITLDRPNSAVTIYRDGRIIGPRDWNGPVTDFASLAPPSGPPSRAAARQERAAPDSPGGSGNRAGSSSNRSSSVAIAPSGGGSRAMDNLTGDGRLPSPLQGRAGIDLTAGGKPRYGGTAPSKAPTTTTASTPTAPAKSATSTMPDKRINYGACSNCNKKPPPLKVN